MTESHTDLEEGARARARKAMRAEVAALAARLMVERGYNETTVDDICALARISRSTFFRYFPSKEDALFGRIGDPIEQLAAALAERPTSETAWVAMRRALDPLIDRYDIADEQFRDIARLIVNTPPLAARHREKNARWHDVLRPEIARRLETDPNDAADPRADALIAAALGCVEAALAAWTVEGKLMSLSKILDRAMGAIR